MAESRDSQHPRPSGQPDEGDDAYALADEETPPPAGGKARVIPPLPRMWKAEPEPEVESKPDRKRKGAAATKAPTKRADGDEDESEEGEKKVLIEETPVLDTIEARRTVRLVMGAVATLLGLMVGVLFVRSFFIKPPEPPVVADQTPDPATVRLRMEHEARALIDRARDVARHGNDDLAVDLLTRATHSYGGTTAAQEAFEALAHARLKQPLFPEVRPLPARAPEPKVATKAAPPGPKPIEPAPPPAPPAVAVTPVPTPPPQAEPPKPAPMPTPPVAVAVVPQPTAVVPQVAVKTLPAGFRARPGTGTHPSGWPLEIFCERDEASMVLVPGGPFTMGRDDGEPVEQPAHRVTLSTYYIDKHEVTVRQFDVFQKERGRRTDRDRALLRGPKPAEVSEDLPVVMVGAREARDYALWAGKDLPTEAQWEGAARGTDGRISPWGFGPPPWEKKRAPRQLDPIMSFPGDVSPFGAYDLAGNAWEWTRDWYDSHYYQQFRDRAADNPTGPAAKPRTGQLTVKGTSKTWDVADREGVKPETRLPYLGFRCALAVEHAAAAPTPAGTAPSPAAPNPAVVPF